MPESQLMGSAAILNALAKARTLPRAALQQAVDRWPEVAPLFLGLLEAACVAEPPERDRKILLFGIYLIAQVRETRAFRPLCIIASHPTLIEELIGDGVTEDLSAIFVRIYDGDPAPLRLLIEAEDADEFVRDAALEALAWLTATGRVDRDETARYLGDLYSTLRPRGESYVWVGWQQAVARLHLENLVPLAEKLFERGWIDPSILSVRDFRKDMLAAQQAVDPAEAFNDRARPDSRLGDIMVEFAEWRSFQPGQQPEPKSLAAASGLAASAPVRNPNRTIGRNDPCPCGSGKKFKKCCLDPAE